MTNNVLDGLTKYELQTLLWAIHYVRNRTNNCGDTMRSLQKKIQSLVDDYCEHEFYLPCPGEIVPFICHKCGFVPKVEKNE